MSRKAGVTMGPSPALKVAVIIPYYQREPGLLRRCLESIARQEGADDVEITVHLVDDGSPSPSTLELADLPDSSGLRIERVETANRGAPAARNTALDQVSAETDVIAFLDSDDTWSPHHVASAVSALNAGFDVYFADHARTGAFDSYFEDAGLEGLLRRAGAEIGDGSILDLSKADIFGLLLRHYLAQSSTVAFRREIAPNLRFDESLRMAGEDHLFWLRLARASRRFCMSRRVGAVCGQGISIYYSSFDWKSDHNIHRVSCLAKLYEAVREGFDLSDPDATFVDEKIRGLRSAMAFFLAHTLLRKRRLPRNLNSVLRLHPHFWRSMALRLPIVAAEMCLGRYRLMPK